MAFRKITVNFPDIVDKGNNKGELTAGKIHIPIDLDEPFFDLSDVEHAIIFQLKLAILRKYSLITWRDVLNNPTAMAELSGTQQQVWVNKP